MIMSEESAVVQKFGAASKTRPPLPEQIKKIDDGPNVCLLFSGTIRVWGKGGVGTTRRPTFASARARLPLARCSQSGSERAALSHLVRALRTPFRSIIILSKWVVFNSLFQSPTFTCLHCTMPANIIKHICNALVGTYLRVFGLGQGKIWTRCFPRRNFVLRLLRAFYSA